MSNQEAIELLMDTFKEVIEDEEDGPVFWIALADTMWKFGRLTKFVKEKTIEIIDTGLDLEKWKVNKKDYDKRVVVLEKLKLQLLSQQPPEKKMKKVFKSFNPFELFDAISYELNSSRFIILKVIGVYEFNGNIIPIFEICDWIGDKIPDIEVINELSCVNDGQAIIGMLGVRDFPKKRINVIAYNVKVVNTEVKQPWHAAWKMLDEILKIHYKLE